jgi:glucose/arabinose dehydrogenase
MRLTRSTTVVAAVVVGGLSLAPLALAQQPAPAPAWKQGMRPEQSSSTLAPHAQPPAAAAARDIPVDRIKVPAGFTVTLWAHGIPNARAMTWGDKGTLFVSSRVAGQVYAVVDRGGQREVKVIAKGLTMPNGVAFKGGTLYVAEISRITRLEGIEDKLDAPPAPAVVYDLLPRDAPHGWKYLSFGPDDKLYFNIGAPCNICRPPETHASIVRVNPDGTGFEYFARGVRNSVGHDFHPVTRELYFTNHGRDRLGEDVPSDTLHHAPRAGLHFGYPHCHQGDVADPDFAQGRACSEFSPPLLRLGAHVAANGIHFYRGGMFPAAYKHRAFIAQRGSWNRTQMSGFRVVMVTLAPGQAPAQEVFAEGWQSGGKFWGRPVYVTEMKDGSLLVSDDYTGAIYRIAYSR